MSTIVETTEFAEGRSDALRYPVAWLPVAVLPAVAGCATASAPPWGFMWALAVSIYVGCKWLTLALSPRAAQAPVWRRLGYLLLWTGMDAETFFGQADTTRPRWSQYAWATWQMAGGVFLLLEVAPRVASSHSLVAGWIAMTGIVSVLHFGLSQLLSVAWRLAGVPARHIMHKPLLATSLADFWGRRWNLAFRDLMHKFVLQPLLPRVGGTFALMTVFLVSGLIHDAVISLAAGGGWGLPTLYFLFQGTAQLFERSRTGKRLGLGRGGARGRIFTAAVVMAPAGLLFHPPFIRQVVVPMVEAIARGGL